MLFRQISLTIRNLRRNLLYAIIVIGGLALGMTVFLAIIQWTGWHVGFDKHFEDADQIYRLSISEKNDDFERHTARIIHGDIVHHFYTDNSNPEIELIGRLSPYRNAIVRNGDIVYYEDKSFSCDPEFLEIFSAEVLIGDPEQILNGPNKIVLSSSLAKKYFGNENPIGQTLELMHQFAAFSEEYEVSGIIKDFPTNSHFKIDLLTSIDKPEDYHETAWVYFKTKQKADIKKLTAEINASIKASDKQEYTEWITPVITPIKDIHLKSHLARELEKNVRYGNVLIIFIAGMLVFLLAWFNFTLLSISQNQLKLKKLIFQWQLGAGKKDFFFQFLIDYLIVGLISFAIAIIFLFILSNPIKNIIGVGITEDNTLFLYSVLIFIVFFILSSIATAAFATFRLYKILRLKYFSKNFKKPHFTSSKNLFIKAVIVIEFVITFVLSCNLILIREQVSYAIDKQIGSADHTTIQIPDLPRPVIDKYDLFKAEIEKHAVFGGITALMEEPGGMAMDAFPFRIEGIEETDDRLYVYPVDENFIRFYDLEVLAGRDFPLHYDTKDTTEFFILNETAAKLFNRNNYDDIIGRELFIDFPYQGFIYPGEIIGIIKDFHLSSVERKIEPMVIFPEYTWLFCYSLKICGDEQEAITILNSIWKELYPSYPLRYQFTTDMYNELYETELIETLVLLIFYLISLLIAGTGLFALSGLFIQQKMHAAAIKKISGAKAWHILLPELTQYFYLAVISAIIALPISWYSINAWLNNFTYQITVNWWIYILITIFIILFSWVAVLNHAIRLARLNPIKFIRNE